MFGLSFFIFIVFFSIFVAPLLLLGFFVYIWGRVRTERYLTIREHVQRGLPLPPELTHGQSPSQLPGNPPSSISTPAYYYSPRDSARRDLRRGINLTATGTALCVTFHVVWPHTSTWAWGLIPWLIGVGYIISSFATDTEDEPPPPKPDPSSPLPPNSP
jgi:hypothetical protein